MKGFKQNGRIEKEKEDAMKLFGKPRTSPLPPFKGGQGVLSPFGGGRGRWLYVGQNFFPPFRY
jgi:hypothetical protein